jgi:hypothetical protein
MTHHLVVRNHGPVSYAIVVRGEVSDRFASAFGGMQLHRSVGQTAIVGVVRDQAALHNVLYRLRNLGIELISLTQVPATPPADAGAGAGFAEPAGRAHQDLPP